MRSARLMTAALAVALLMAGCSKATSENYEKVGVGMSKDKVHEILGKPSKVEGTEIGPMSLSVETWNNDPVVITITYNGDEVGMKSITGNEKK